MKFLVLFSVLALCAINVNGTFHKLLKKGGGSHSDASASASGHASGGLGGLADIGKLLAIPLGIKKQLLLSHQKKINAKFDHIIGTLSKFSSKFEANSNGAAHANVDVHGDIGNDIGLTAIGTGNHDGSAAFEPVEFSSGSSSGSASVSSGSESSFGGLSVGGNGGFDSGYQQNVQTYQPAVQSYQPAVQSYQPAVQSYQPAVQSYQPAVQSYHPQPAAQTQYHQTPVTVELYQVQQPAPIAPSQNYGPPNYQPPAVVQPQIIQEVQQPPTIQRDYLPPHTHQPGCTH